MTCRCLLIDRAFSLHLKSRQLHEVNATGKRCQHESASRTGHTELPTRTVNHTLGRRKRWLASYKGSRHSSLSASSTAKQDHSLNMT